MGECALAFLGGRVGWLEDEDGLCEDEEGAGVEEGVCGKSRKAVSYACSCDGILDRHLWGGMTYKMRGWRKTLAQTEATRRTMPA